MNILITGGAGFIGSHFVRYAYKTWPGACIVNLDLLTYAGNLENLSDIEALDAQLPEHKHRYRFVHGSICNADLINELCAQYKFDLIVNFAAETHVDRSIINISDFISTNIGGVRCLIEAVRAHKLPRFIHISTDEVYGDIAAGHCTEEYPLRPSNPYSSSKAAADLIILSFVRTHGLPAIIIRGSNNYGTYQYPEKLIPLAISNLIEGKQMPVHGQGLQVRSWLHVEDFCGAIGLIAQKSPVHEVYNVAGEERTNLDILTMVAAHLKTDLLPKMVFIPDRPGADMRYSPDATKIHETLSWSLRHSLDKDMPNIIDWYLEHKDWWMKIKQTKEFQDHYVKQEKGQWY